MWRDVVTTGMNLRGYRNAGNLWTNNSAFTSRSISLPTWSSWPWKRNAGSQPKTLGHIAENTNLQQHHCEDLKSRTQYLHSAEIAHTEWGPAGLLWLRYSKKRYRWRAQRLPVDWGETHVRKTEDNIKLDVQRNGPYRNEANMRHNKKNCTIRLLLFRGDLQVQ